MKIRRNKRRTGLRLRTARLGVVVGLTACALLGGVIVVARIAAAQAATSPSAAPTSVVPTIPAEPLAPPAKQALINSINARRLTAPSPYPATPTLPSGYQSVNPAMIEASNQPCTRDVSDVASGINGPLSDLDFPEYKEYHFNNEWVDPDGSLAVMAGDFGGSQGVVAVELWAPPTHCAPTSHAIFMGPTGSGSFSISSLSSSVVSLTSGAGTRWSFDLATDALTEVS